MTSNERFLDAVARRTATEIVERYAGDPDALRAAIARLARQGLEGHLRQFEQQLQDAPLPQP